MANLLQRMFNSQPEATETQEAPASQPAQAEAFFLEPDEAKTLGNLDYMRSTRKIRRTFAGGGELVQEVSAMSKTVQSGKKRASKVTEVESTPLTPISAPKSAQETERQRTDTSLDMFRSMAKDMKR